MTQRIEAAGDTSGRIALYTGDFELLDPVVEPLQRETDGEQVVLEATWFAAPADAQATGGDPECDATWLVPRIPAPSRSGTATLAALAAGLSLGGALGVAVLTGVESDRRAQPTPIAAASALPAPVVPVFTPPVPSAPASARPAPSVVAAPRPAPSVVAAPRPAPSAVAAPRPAPSAVAAPRPAPSAAGVRRHKLAHAATARHAHKPAKHHRRRARHV